MPGSGHAAVYILEFFLLVCVVPSRHHGLSVNILGNQVFMAGRRKASGDDADGIIPLAFHQSQVIRVKTRAPFADKTSRFFNTECLQQHLGHFRIFFIHSPGNHRLRIRERPGQLPCLDGNSSFANDIRAIVVPPCHVCGGIPSNALNIA